MNVHQQLDEAVSEFANGNQFHASTLVRDVIKRVSSQVTEWETNLDGTKDPADETLRVQLQRAREVWSYLSELADE